MAGDPVKTRGRLVAGIMLTALGLLVWFASSVQSHREQRSFSDGGPAPRFIAVTAGHTYSIAAPGGGRVPAGASVDPAGPACTLAERGAAPARLDTTAETNTKALNRIGGFTAPVSGDVHVQCDGFADVYIDDADGAFDVSGALILLATILLTLGVPLLLSGIAMLFRLDEPHEIDDASALDNRVQEDKSHQSFG